MSADYADLTRSFATCDIDASALGHVDHVGVAYEMLRAHGFLNASQKHAECINTIATKAGAARNFNTTITMPSLSLIAERMQTTEHQGYDEFISNNQDRVTGNPLEVWYSPERLPSDLAAPYF